MYCICLTRLRLLSAIKSIINAILAVMVKIPRTRVTGLKVVPNMLPHSETEYVECSETQAIDVGIPQHK